MHTFVVFVFVITLIGVLREFALICLGKYPEPSREVTLRYSIRTSLMGVAILTWAGVLLFA